MSIKSNSLCISRLLFLSRSTPFQKVSPQELVILTMFICNFHLANWLDFLPDPWPGSFHNQITDNESGSLISHLLLRWTSYWILQACQVCQVSHYLEYLIRPVYAKICYGIHLIATSPILIGQKYGGEDRKLHNFTM